MLRELIYFILIVFIVVDTKPFDQTVEYSNDIDGDQQGNHETIQSKEIENHSDHTISSTLETVDSTNGLTPVRDLKSDKNNNKSHASREIVADESDISTIPPSNANITTNILSTIWDSFLHKFNFSPQLFFQDRLGIFKEILSNYGTLLANNPVRAKQLFEGNGLIHLAGLDDNGFYTNRLQPAGFLGGNGWFANKGGLLGGPGAILSTGSVLTDYPSPYKKKK